MSLRVELVVPDGEIWSGRARMVIAKTLEGDVGILTSHPSVLGLLAEGSVIRILDPEQGQAGAVDAAQAAGEVRAAVSSGFLSVHDDRVSILAREAELGSQVDRAAVRAELDASVTEVGPGEEEPAEVKYSRARLRAAGDGS
ncbi:MAG TPA: F0F1 ATP synthase subunit epsilon [Streptosporangiaceae bacterium]|nr:F0F1 ATP synthase subunit epsilon [Streptosporangiaceae bacterium]